MKLAIMFNGQGAHFEKMGLDFMNDFPQASKVFIEAEQITKLPIRQWIEEEIHQLAKTANAQVAIATTSIAIFRAIEDLLPEVVAMGGLSLGEYSALIASGMLDQKTGWELLKTRGQLMSSHCESITDSQMAAVIAMPLDTIEALVTTIAKTKEIYIANYNAPTQIVIAGEKDAISEFKLQAKKLGYKKVLPLKVEGPFHTPMMKGVQTAFLQYLEQIHFNESDIPVWSNVTVEPHQIQSIKDQLIEHFIQPVYWYQTVDQWIANGITHIIQIGPGDTLAKLLANQYPDTHCCVVNQVEDVEKVKEFLRS